MGMKFLPTALLGSDNTSLSCIGPLLKSLAIHLGKWKNRQFVPIYHPCLLEMPVFPEIMILSFPLFHSFWERNSLKDWKGHVIRNQAILTLSLILPITSAWSWTSLMLTTTSIINFNFFSYFYLLDVLVRTLHLLSYVILTSFKVGIYLSSPFYK